MSYAGQHQMSVAQFNLGGLADQLLEKFGPLLTELLLELLLKKSEPSFVAAPDDIVGALDSKNLMLLLLEKFGPTLMNKLADHLDTRDDLFSKLAAMALREYGDELLKLLLDMLKSPVGTDAFTGSAA